VIHNLELSLVQEGKNILANSSPEFRTRPITDNIGFNRIPTTPSDKNFSVYLKSIFIYIYFNKDQDKDNNNKDILIGVFIYISNNTSVNRI